VLSSHINPPPKVTWYAVFSLVSRSMNSGAPASIAPAESASVGMMVWQRDWSVLYWCAAKNFGT
jgi:hypothetical protein